MKLIIDAFKWAAGELWEKINLVETWREIKALGKKHGRRFFIFALIWEIIEDGVFPFLSWNLGVPELIPLFLIFHFEPIAYPAAFWAFKTWDRSQGREPWEPDRSAMSSYLRSTTKTALYRVAAVGLFWLMLAQLDLSLWFLTGYALLMTLFGFIHERIWHDQNYGVNPITDVVSPKRTLAKSLTYRLVSISVMSTALFGLLGAVPWSLVLAYQGLALVLYLGLETFWSTNEWGLSPTVKPEPDA